MFAALLALSLSAPPALSQTSDPAQFVIAFNREVSAQLRSTAIDPAERKRRFATLVDEGLDLDVIGSNLLGWRWMQAAPADRLAFRREFRRYLIHRFAASVTGLDAGRIMVTGVVGGGNDALVVTEFTGEDGGRVTLSWRVVRGAAGWRLSDIIVNNVSLAAIMRSQFDAALQNAQPGIGPLLLLLHEKSLG